MTKLESLVFSKMDADPFVLDISSDDEQVTAAPPPQPGKEGYEWFWEILRDFDKEKESQEKHQPPREEEEDFDDIVIAGECFSPPKPRRSGSKLSVSFSDDDDDDCVVLDGDPDGPVEVNDGALDVGDGDELLVVGQKGQIACRDYPHSRHLCNKFPFNSSPHGKHCELCHCYVCDIPAPCAYWGKGVSKVDHCHATDKQELWKSLRKNFRLGKVAPLPPASTTIPVAVTQINQIAPVRLPTTLVPPNMVSRPSAIRPCSSSAPFGVPNVIGQYRDQQSVQRSNGLVPCAMSQQALGVSNIIGQCRDQQSVHRSNWLAPRAISQQALGIRHNLIHHGRVPAVNDSCGQFVLSSNAMFKKSSTVGRPLPTNHSPHSRRHSPLLQYAGCSAPLASSADKNTGGKQDALSNIVSESFSSLTNLVMGANALGSELTGLGVSQPNPNVNLVGNRSQYDTAPILPHVDFSRLLSESNQEMSVGNIQLQNTWTNNEPSPVKQLSSQLSGGGYCENWLSSQSVPMPSEDLAPGLNVFPSQLPACDASMLYFDFETPWKSVTHA